VETKEFATSHLVLSKELIINFIFIRKILFGPHKTNETWQTIYENESITCEQIIGNGLNLTYDLQIIK
jgi:hypothetical protein